MGQETEEASLPVVAGLNLQRDAFRKNISIPLVFWLPDSCLDAIARGAPDFWSWRSAIFSLELPSADRQRIDSFLALWDELGGKTGIAPESQRQADHISSTLSEIYSRIGDRKQAEKWSEIKAGLTASHRAIKEKDAAVSMKNTQVRLVRIFLSSPSDVADERAVVEEAVNRINRTDGNDLGVRLEIWKWERDLVPHIGPKPQSVVNAQMPLEYDIYLGILAHRFGTPTEHFNSGTEVEFRDALEKWQITGKPWIMFYFKDSPVDPFKLDLDQFAKVLAFRKEVEKLGIYDTFTVTRGAENGFFEKVEMHLRKLIREHLGKSKSSKIASSPGKIAISHEISKDYLKWLQQQCSSLDLLGLKMNEGRALRLNNVYVPLTTPVGTSDSSKDKIVRREEEKPQLLLDLLDKKSLYVSGDPGSGKSTFCRWVAWLCCEGNMPHREVEEPEDYRERFPDSLKGRLPLLVRLRDFWMYRPEDLHGDKINRKPFEKWLERWLNKSAMEGLTWDTVQWHIEHGSALLIFDGLDEVPSEYAGKNGKVHPKAMVFSGLAEAIAVWNKAGNRVLATARPYGLSDVDVRNLGLPHHPIQELAEPLQELLVHRWFYILTDQTGLSQTEAKHMIDHLRARKDLDVLVANALLLTATCILYNQGKRLPQDKHDLYERIVDIVLYNRFKDREIDKIRNRLCVVAYGMHTGEGLGENRTTPQAIVTNDEIMRMLEAYQEKQRHTETGFEDLLNVRDLLLFDSGILIPRDTGKAGFYHLSIQEFLAAQRLWDLKRDNLPALFARYAKTPEWHNTLSFLFGAQLSKSTDPDRSIKLVEKLIAKIKQDELGLQVVLSDCLEILLGKGIRLPAHEKKFQKLCRASIEIKTPLRERHKLGLILGKLGDPRIVNDLRELKNPHAWIKVPADKYPIGAGKAEYKLPKQVFEIPKPLLFSKYPVVNSQFSEFIKAGGYEQSKWWSKEGWEWRKETDISEPAYWRNAKWNNPNQPVVGVSYWEAEAFCQWVGGRLPAEREWEAAARGPEGYEYPWGSNWKDGICNTDEANLGVTTPVGIFPRSRSKSFELEDMAGNVWEWCSDEFREGEYVGRVVRGGSWYLNRELARADFRYWWHPDYRNLNVGFRVVHSLSPGLK